MTRSQSFIVFIGGGRGRGKGRGKQQSKVNVAGWWVGGGIRCLSGQGDLFFVNLSKYVYSILYL